MPTYDFQCTQCKLLFEAHQSIDAATPNCSACGNVTEKVILSAPAMHGNMARGWDLAVRSLQPKPDQTHKHAPGCDCGRH